MIGETIKKIRVFKKISQKALAAKLGIAQNTLYRYECGDRAVSLEMLQKIADALEVSADTLLVDPSCIPERKSINFPEAAPDAQLHDVTSEDVQNVIAALGDSFRQLHDTMEKLNDKGQKEVNRYAEYLTTQDDFKK